MNYFMFYVIVTAIGLGSVVIALIFNILYRKFATIVPGTIVGFADMRSRQVPIVEIQEESGTKEIRCKYGFRSSKYKKGQQVEIYYRPDGVKNAIIVGDYSDVWALLIVAVLLLAIGLLQYLRYQLIIK